MGSSSISSSAMAASTGTWNSASRGSVANAETNPMTFYTDLDMPKESWASLKTVNDPCPAGWRVPDGGDYGIWSTALGSLDNFSESILYDETNEGMNFSGKFGSASTIWYPASGYRHYNDSSLRLVGDRGHYWSASPYSNVAYFLYFYDYGLVFPSDNSIRAFGCSVRCLQ